MTLLSTVSSFHVDWLYLMDTTLWVILTQFSVLLNHRKRYHNPLYLFWWKMLSALTVIIAANTKHWEDASLCTTFWNTQMCSSYSGLPLSFLCKTKNLLNTPHISALIFLVIYVPICIWFICFIQTVVFFITSGASSEMESDAGVDYFNCSSTLIKCARLFCPIHDWVLDTQSAKVSIELDVDLSVLGKFSVVVL